MATLVARIQECSELIDADGPTEAAGIAYAGDDATVAIENPAAENGEIETSGDGLSWLNSARVIAHPERDEIHVTISIGDPRGCFVMTARRLRDGRIVLHLPHPGEGMAHLPTAELHPGTLVITHEAGDASKPVIFAMDPPAGEDDEDDEDV